MDSGAWAASSVVEDPEGIANRSPGIWVGSELPIVPLTTIEIPSDVEVEATAPPVLARGEPESLPGLGASKDIEAPSGNSERVAGSDDPSGTALESLMLSSE